MFLLLAILLAIRGQLHLRHLYALIPYLHQRVLPVGLSTMGHTIDKIGIEIYVMAQFPIIMMGQIVEDGRMVRADGAEAGDEGEGMGHTVPRIQGGKGVGLVADQTMKDIHLSEANGTVSLILGGDVRCMIIAR